MTDGAGPTEGWERTPRPTPGLDPAPLTPDEHEDRIPEYGGGIREGFLYGYGGDQEDRLDVLSCLLKNVGLRVAVRLAPRALWLQALTEAEEADDA